MNQEIIHKLGLKPTDKEFGFTGTTNVTVFSFVEEVYCAACDSLGFPVDDYVIFFSFRTGNHIRLFNEFILDTPLHILKLILLRRDI